MKATLFAVAAILTLSIVFAAPQSGSANLLITTEWLSKHLQDKDLVVLHSNWTRSSYKKAHIPGARFLWINGLAKDTPDRSTELPSKEEAVRLHNEKNQANKKGNRLITLELLKELKSETFGDLFELEFTSLNDQGEILSQVVKFQGLRDRQLSFSAFLMYLAILQKGWDVPVDFSQGYDECKVILEDESAWIRPGAHYMILKKK